MLAYESWDRWLMPLTTDDCKSLKTYEVVFSCRDATTNTPYVICRPFAVDQDDGQHDDDAPDDLMCLAVAVCGDDANDKTVICTPTVMDEEVRNEVMHAFLGQTNPSHT